MKSALRFFSPTAIAFEEAIPIAALGLVVNVASAWLLSRGGHDHHHGMATATATATSITHHDETKRISIAGAPLELSIFETDAPPRFRLEGAGRAQVTRDGRGGNIAFGRLAAALRDGRSRSLSGIGRTRFPSRMRST